MDSEEGEPSAAPDDGYDDEILDANWLPRPDAPLTVVRSAARDEAKPPADPENADAFLRAIYRNQE